MSERPGWFEIAKLAEHCCELPPTRCPRCEPTGMCENCGGPMGTFEGRDIEVINEYASACDGCHELTHHDLMEIDPNGDEQLGFCEDCRPDLFEYRGKDIYD